ncbi:hypothetical protein HYPSUDRAFT_42568 [Hypholoma sublateritium FD-334 SS-4]|uniref:F-box domain-containing protein n=1 Tax=Hypholoma sublateritium (strain FD-334 SS-4) TaxID=945553 RepID=A0A0D2L2M0_HYPSF|nr:hypothetical protein HYPSUDRAFT_42568 [Hypholoma sublateritium FD-334 SS-4]
MSIYPHAPAIHSLNMDILSYIFTLNADMFPYEGRNALHTTRITSQVCQNWRDLMLATPTLWARLIDIDCLSDPWNIGWTEELIRRSGAALLWIRVESCLIDEDGDDSDVAEFLLHIIYHNWHRIQKLVVHDQLDDLTFHLIQKAYESPAPHLETFDVSFNYMEGYEYDCPPTSFPSPFGGHAPMLRRFRLDNYTLDQRAPWLCQLHSLVLDGEYNVCDVLAVLMATHSLQELKINLQVEANGDTPQSSPPFPIVSFPHLRSLDCTGQSRSCTTLLDHIEISPGCSLIMSVSNSLEETDEQHLSAVDAFNRHARRFLKSNVFRTVSLTRTPRYLSSLPLARIDTSPVDPQYCITITLADKHALFAAILNRLTHLDLSGTTTLRLCSDGPLDPSFFSRLSSLDTICVNEMTLRHLVLLQDDMNTTEKPDILIPSLTVLDFVFDHNADPNRGRPTTDHIAVAKKFILSRTHNGYPIAMLNITRCSPFDLAPNLDGLAECKGLKVLYRLSKMSGIFEHICGSGKAAKHIVTI